MNLNIYQIEKSYLTLIDTIIENGGEITPEQENELAITKESLETKGRSYGYVIKSLETDIDVIDAEIKRLSALKSSRNKIIDRMKETVSNAMQMFEIDKLETPTLKISFRKSESVEVPNIDLLDKEFVVEKITYSANKTAIKEAIKLGVTVVGATLNVNKNIQIK